MKPLAVASVVLISSVVSNAAAQPVDEPPAPAPAPEPAAAPAPADAAPPPVAAPAPAPLPAPAPPAADAAPPEAPASSASLTTPPEGRAAPPTEAATRSTAKLRAGLEVFAEYNYRRTSGPGTTSTWFHAFDVPRVHAAIEGVYDETLRGRVLLEAVRSASEGALIGVAGDSLVIRAREAYGAYRPVEALEVSAGIVPSLTIPELDGTWMLRAVAPSGLEASGLGAAADLGAKVRFEIPGRYGWLGLAATNGEGYTSRELNRGKNLEGAFEVHPLPRGALLPLGVFASYTSGSTSTVSARADRLTSGLVWQGRVVRAGAFFTYAWGVAQAGTQHAALGTAFLRVEPVARLLAGARVDVSVRDVRTAPADAISTVWLTAGYRLADPVEVFVAGTRTIPTTRAEAEIPGADSWSLRIIGRVVF